MAAENIFQQYLQPVRSVADYSADMDKAESNKLALAASRMTNQQAQQAFADDQAARQASIQSGGDQNKLLQLLQQSGNYKAAQTLQKSMFDAQKVQADTTLANAHASNFDQQTAASKATQLYEAAQHHAQGLAYVKTPQDAQIYIKQGIDKGVFPPMSDEQIQQKLAQFPSVEAFKEQAAQAAIPVLDRYKTEAENARNKLNNDTSIANNTATNATSRANNASTVAASVGNNRANIAKDFALAGLGPDGKDVNGGVGGLTPAAIENAASRYNLDGTLPPSIGRGTQGARDLRTIQNRAAELATGQNGTDLRISQMDNKAAASALSQVVKAQNMAGSFEKTASANADLALGLSKQMDRTGIPLLNAGLQAWRTGTGSPEATQFAAANATFVGEYAKIMSGGMGNGPTSDAARSKAEKLLTTSMTAAQYEGNVRLLQKEMQNRMKSFDDQTAQIRAKMGGKTAPNPAPASGTQPAAGGLPAGWSVEAH